MKYLQLLYLFFEFVSENPDVVAKLQELFEAIKKRLAGGVYATGDCDQCEAVFVEVFGFSATAADPKERRRWLELIQLIFENWDKLAPIFFKAG